MNQYCSASGDSFRERRNGSGGVERKTNILRLVIAGKKQK